MKTIATIYNQYKDKFAVPRQSGLASDVVSEIVFEKEFRNDDALRGIEEYSHLWLIWKFSQIENDQWKPTVRPPKLGGNKRVGVFATRSPYRPNGMGLSSVKLIGIEKTKDRGTILKVSGADLISGTPILDIKPYIKYTDSHPDAVCSFADRYSQSVLKVVFEAQADEQTKKELTDILKHDPRPAYHDSEKRVYGATIGKKEVRFKVLGDTLLVTEIREEL